MKNDWVETTLGEVCRIIPGIGFPKSKQGKPSGKFPFYKVGDISRNVARGSRRLIVCENYVDEDDIPHVERKLVPPNSITFAKIGEALKLNRRCMTTTDSLVDNNAVGVKAFCGLEDWFLFFYFLTIRLENYSRATTVPSVRKSDIEQIAFPLAPLPEQRAIVAKIEGLFSELDQGVADLKAAQSQLKIYRQAVLKKAFEGGFTQSREKGEYFDINGIRAFIPAKWKVCSLGKKASLQGGFAFRSAEYTSEGIPIVKIKNVHYEHIDWSDKTFVDSSREKEFSAYALRAGDVLIAMTRPVIKSLNNVKTVVVRECDLPAFLNQRVGRFLTSETIDKGYLKYFIFTDFFKNRVIKESSASQQPNISSKKIESFDFILPPLPEQHQIVKEIEARLSVCDELERSLAAGLEKAAALRQSILKKAFAGELLSAAEREACRAAADYEPAAQLLKKINHEGTKDTKKTA